MSNTGTGNMSQALVPAQRSPARQPTDIILIHIVRKLRPGELAPKWVPDAEAPCCIGCAGTFSFTTRRHHCRCCGKVFCGNCSSKKAKLEYINGKEARVCDRCFSLIKTRRF